MKVEIKEKTRDRQAWMGLLARADTTAPARLWARYGAVPGIGEHTEALRHEFTGPGAAAGTGHKHVLAGK